MNNFLKIQDYEEINEYLTKLNQEIVRYEEEMTKALSAFENDAMVQQFYSSGKYGYTIAERIDSYKKVVIEYVNALSNGENSLIVHTKQYVANQIELLSRQSNVNNGTTIPKGGNN